jgi:hypothetical protein
MGIKERAREQLNWLEKILHKLPGFKGYYERELRRDSDRLQREFIIRQQRKVKSGMNKVIRSAARAKDFDLLREYDLFVREIDKSIGALRYADQGYSGFFDLVKIREPELDKVYEQDVLAMEAAETFVAEFKDLSSAPLDPSALASLRAALARIDDHFENRNTLLKGYERGEGR